MFKPMSFAEFVVGDKKAFFMIDRGMSTAETKTILSRITHYCVEIEKAREAEEAQLLKDEEANKVPELEEASKEGENEEKKPPEEEKE